MNKEDYNKFYIQGSDHYLIPKDVFDELFDEMKNWKKENQKLKAELQLYKGSLKREREAIHRVNDFGEVIDKLKDKTKENIENAKCEVTTLTIGDKAYYQYIEKILDNYVDILKEVE